MTRPGRSIGADRRALDLRSTRRGEDFAGICDKGSAARSKSGPSMPIPSGSLSNEHRVPKCRQLAHAGGRQPDTILANLDLLGTPISKKSPMHSAEDNAIRRNFAHIFVEVPVVQPNVSFPPPFPEARYGPHQNRPKRSRLARGPNGDIDRVARLAGTQWRGLNRIRTPAGLARSPWAMPSPWPELIGTVVDGDEANRVAARRSRRD